MKIEFEQMIQSHNQRIEEKNVLVYYIDAAFHVDFENGSPYSTPLVPGVDAKMCLREGKTMMNYLDKDYAGVVISKEKME